MTIDEIPSVAFHRMANLATIKRVSKYVADELRGVTLIIIHGVVKNAIVRAENDKRKIIKKRDIIDAITDVNGTKLAFSTALDIKACEKY